MNPTVTKVKYEKEARLLFGVALVQLPNGDEEGRRCIPYDYTDKTIVPHEEWLRHKKEEIRHVNI